jgi:hypothetical protein
VITGNEQRFKRAQQLQQEVKTLQNNVKGTHSKLAEVTKQILTILNILGADSVDPTLKNRFSQSLDPEKAMKALEIPQAHDWGVRLVIVLSAFCAVAAAKGGAW